MSRPTLDTALSTYLSLTGLSPSLAGFPKTILLNSLNHFRGPNPSVHAHWFGLFRFRSPLLPESHVVFSSSGYLDVSVHRVPLHTLCIGVWILEVCSSGFPHSEISGSLDICSSPKLFAAYHVFHRLLVPRHPPYALLCITNSLPSTGMDKSHTCIALHALVTVNFFTSFSSKQFMFSHDLGCLFYLNLSLYAVFKVHVDNQKCRPESSKQVFRSRIFVEYPSVFSQILSLK